jgi:hypothetical protein
MQNFGIGLSRKCPRARRVRSDLPDRALRHAGWRGTTHGIAMLCLQAQMREPVTCLARKPPVVQLPTFDQGYSAGFGKEGMRFSKFTESMPYNQRCSL